MSEVDFWGDGEKNFNSTLKNFRARTTDSGSNFAEVSRTSAAHDVILGTDRWRASAKGQVASL